METAPNAQGSFYKLMKTVVSSLTSDLGDGKHEFLKSLNLVFPSAWAKYGPALTRNKLSCDLRVQVLWKISEQQL